MSMAIFELKGQPPASIDPNRPAPLCLALERMKPKARDVHVFDRLRRIEGSKEHLQPPGVVWLNAGRTARLKELS